MTLRVGACGSVWAVLAMVCASSALGTLACSNGATSTGAPGAQAPLGPTYGAAPGSSRDRAASLPTTTPIKHLVVIFGENNSFDHYFGTYPHAKNEPGETPFNAAAGTPAINNLVTPLDPTKGFAPVPGVDLLKANPNFTNAANATGASNPFRLPPAHAATEDMDHQYRAEQLAFDNNAMDLFPKHTGTAAAPPGTPPNFLPTTAGVMAHFDGNTVSVLWNLAQSYALNDNAWSTTFGPSTIGAINLVSGQTNGLGTTNKSPSLMPANIVVADGNGGYTLIGDPDPYGDVCSTLPEQVSFKGKNIGDLLNAGGVSWGFFEGGFDLMVTNPNGTTGCARQTNPTVSHVLFKSNDYIPHHEAFQFYPSTANPTHARPSSVAAIGNTLQADGTTPDPAKHQYDAHDFFDALQAGNFPAVSYLKAPAYQDGHAGYSDPLDEQQFIGKVVGAVMNMKEEWASTAIVLLWDDSDGWYDHQAPPIVNPSSSAADALNGASTCKAGAQQTGAAPGTPLLGTDGKPAQGRCGHGTRIPLLVVSPFAKRNFVDHTMVDQTSVLRFIEDNWLGGKRVQPGGSFDTIAGPLTNMFTFPPPASPAPARGGT